MRPSRENRFFCPQLAGHKPLPESTDLNKRRRNDDKATVLEIGTITETRDAGVPKVDRCKVIT